MESVPAKEPPMDEGQKTKVATPKLSPETPAKLGARTFKSDAVLKMLSRGRGATLAEVSEATSWQLHSARAFFSGLRKRGLILVREERKNGETAYHIAKPGSDS